MRNASTGITEMQDAYNNQYYDDVKRFAVRGDADEWDYWATMIYATRDNNLDMLTNITFLPQHKFLFEQFDWGDFLGKSRC